MYRIIGDFEMIVDWEDYQLVVTVVFIFREYPQVKFWISLEWMQGAQVGFSEFVTTTKETSRATATGGDNPIDEWNYLRIKIGREKASYRTFKCVSWVTDNVV